MDRGCSLGTPAEGQAGAGDSGSETGNRGHNLSCLLLTFVSGFLEILEVDGGASPGAKAGNAVLDYEVVDRPGECTQLPVSPQLGHRARRRSEDRSLPGGK